MPGVPEIVYKLQECFRLLQQVKKDRRNRAQYNTSCDALIATYGKEVNFQRTGGSKTIISDINELARALVSQYCIEEGINHTSIITTFIRLLPEPIDELFEIFVVNDIAQVVWKRESLRETHDTRIRRHLTEIGYTNIDIATVGRGTHSAFIVKMQKINDGDNLGAIETKYVKTCAKGPLTANDNSGLINPNELFLYKVLEYLDFGPRTNFLIRVHSSASLTDGGYLSYIAYGNYIMTDEIPNFITDTKVVGDGEDKEQVPNSPEMFSAFIASHDKEDVIELSAALLIRDILSLQDTFYVNGENYGLARRQGDTDRFKFMFVDHLPGVNGALTQLSEDKKKLYSPRLTTKVEIETDLSRYTQSIECHSNFSPSQLTTNLDKWVTKSVSQETHQRIFGKDGTKLEKALDMAKQDIFSLIEKYRDNFITSSAYVIRDAEITEERVEMTAEQTLSTRISGIKQKVRTYYETDYAKQATHNSERL